MPHPDKKPGDSDATPSPSPAAGDGQRTSRTRTGSRRSKGGPGSGAVGMLVLDKPIGMTSMTAVSIIRRRVGAKAGHAGTLDPLATGVLVIAVGAATKSLDRFMRTRKGYLTEVDLSAFTATDDREGDPEAVEVETPPTALDLERALAERFTGEFLQKPPAFSAKKVDGRRAYQTARQGGDPKLEPRPVRVHEIRLESYDWPIATISIACDKGFYVRSLARDLGNVLGTGGHCASIRRTAVGPFTLDDAIALDDVPDPLPADRLVPLPTAMARLDADQADTSS